MFPLFQFTSESHKEKKCNHNSGRLWAVTETTKMVIIKEKLFFFGSDKNANRLKTILVFTCNAFNWFGNAVNGIVGNVT